MPKTLDGELTLWDIAQRWLDVYVAVKRPGRTGKSTAERTEKYLLAFLGKTPVADLNEEDFFLYRARLERKGLKEGTVRLYLADCLCLMGWAGRRGYVQWERPKGLLPVLQEEPPKRITNEEAERVTALPDPLGFACRLFLGSGMRWGEGTRAEASHIDRDGVLTISKTKGKKVRRVPLPPRLAAECRTHIGKLLPWARPCSDYFNKKVIEGAKVPGFHAHQLRHTFAYRWIESGGSLATLQRVLGHASLEMTMRYARPDDELVSREAERVHKIGNW